jgi:fucose permease
MSIGWVVAIALYFLGVFAFFKLRENTDWDVFIVLVWPLATVAFAISCSMWPLMGPENSPREDAEIEKQK